MNFRSFLPVFPKRKYVILNVMRIAILLFFGTTFGFSPLTGLSQEVIHFKSTQVLTVDAVFEEIEAQTPFRFIYRSNLFKDAPKVKVKKGKVEVDRLLKNSLSDLSFDFEVTGNTIVLIPRSYISTSTVKEDQQQEITGTVMDEDGVPLPGVNITVEGTSRGTSTDFDGNYEIKAEKGQKLVFSSVGFENQSIEVSDDTEINIQMKAGSSLDEVVVVGYGTQRKSDLTGAVSSVKPDDIQQTPITSIDQGLGGRAPGVMVTQTSGAPGAISSIRIRGSSSLQGGNEPLYVIDGMPIYNGSGFGNSGGSTALSGLSTINPSDIGSIEILKDASATSIYGARAANGVVLITTKKGKRGRDNISVEGSFGVQNVAKKINVMNALEYATLVNEAYTNDGLAPYYSEQEMSEIRANPEGTDWQDELFRTALTQNYQVKFSGGNEKTTYLISGNYYNQEGVIKNSGFERFIGRINLDRNMFESFRIGTNLNVSKIQSKESFTAAGGRDGVVSAAMKFNPVLPVYRDEEAGIYTPVNSPGLIYANPVATAIEDDRKTDFTRFLGQIYGELDLASNLKLRSSFGFDIFNRRFGTFIPSILYESGGIATAEVSNEKTVNWLNENILSYENQFNEDNFISAVAGITFQKNVDEGFLTSSEDFVNDLLGYNNLEGGSVYNQPSSMKTEWSLLSYLARVNYTYKNRYLFTLSSRMDGSSRFGKNNKYALFPSGSVAWRIDQEPFLENSQQISNLKIRMSYGVTGNQEIGLYNSLPILTSATYTFGGENTIGVYPEIVPNPDLKWEKTSQFDVGLDLGLWHNRVNLTADYYHKKTTDLIYDFGIPYVSGFSTSLRNIGSVQNTGFELGVESMNLTGDFSWTSSFNISFNRNKVIDLGGESYRDIGQGDDHLKTGSVHRLIVGKPIGLFYGYKFDGIFQNQEEVDKGPSGPTDVIGGRRYKDLDGDGKISAEKDRTVIGDPNPDFYGGFSNTFSYKGFEFNVFMQYSYGADLFNYNAMELKLPSGGQNVHRDLVRRWTPDNPSNEFPRATTNRSAVFSDTYIEDASYLKIKNISLAYTFPNLNVKGIEGLKIYVTGENLLTFTKYKGYDPEVSYRGVSNIEIGEDFGGYPQTKTYLLGIKLDIQ